MNPPAGDKTGLIFRGNVEGRNPAEILALANNLMAGWGYRPEDYRIGPLVLTPRVGVIRAGRPMAEVVYRARVEIFIKDKT